MNWKMKGVVSLCMHLVLIALLSSFMVSSMIMSAGSSPDVVYAVEPTTNVCPGVGETITVEVMVYDADWMYSWQVHMVWDELVLSYSSHVFGGFLADQPEGSSINVRIESNFFIIGEATVGSHQGKSAAEGLLLSVTFLVASEGETTLDISSDFTYYLWCFQVPMTEKRYPIRENGYVVLPLDEDLNADGVVDIFDLSSVALKVESGPGYDGPEDINGDGYVDVIDLTLVSLKYGTYANY